MQFRPGTRILFCAVIGAMLIGSGCAYTCHKFEFREAVVQPSGWRVRGEVTRSHPADWEPGPGSWPHWAPDPDDQYRLTLYPIAPDSGFWANGTVEFAHVVAIARADTIEIVRSGHSERTFSSEPFYIAASIPDTLFVEFELKIHSALGDGLEYTVPVRAAAPALRHRRWHIADMAES